MEELNLFSITYIAFRLAPFILVSFFSLLSIMNQDVKGLIYLAGLLLATAVAVFMGNTLSKYFSLITPSDPYDKLYEGTTRVCNLLTLSKSGPISILPLSMVIFSFTFFYLFYGLYFVGNNLNDNIPTLIIFPLIMIMDGLWHLSNNCNTIMGVLFSLIIGGGVGLLWGYVLQTSKASALLYFNGLSTKETCNIPTKQSFRCKVKTVTSSL